jgi:hypothetical protein
LLEFSLMVYMVLSDLPPLSITTTTTTASDRVENKASY